MIIFIILIIAFNIFSIFLCGIVLKGLDKSKVIKIIAINEIINIIAIMLVYYISSKNISKEIVDAGKIIIPFAFLPINIIISAITYLRVIGERELNELDDKLFKKEMIFWCIIFLIILIIEGKRFLDIESSIAELKSIKESTSNMTSTYNGVDME